MNQTLSWAQATHHIQDDDKPRRGILVREHMTPSELEQWDNAVFVPYDPLRRRYRHDISQPEVWERLRPFFVTRREAWRRKTSRYHFTAEEIAEYEKADPLSWRERVALWCCPQHHIDEGEIIDLIP